MAFVVAFKHGSVAWSLGADDVHVWIADLDQVVSNPMCSPTNLSGDELARAVGIQDLVSRRRFICARSLLRTILGGYCAAEPQTLSFEYGPFGKPALAAQAGRSPVKFNLAHCEAVALFAVTEAGDVGVDVERIRAIPDWEDIAESRFPVSELGRLRALPEIERPAAFMGTWTRLEAMLKAMGWGWIVPEMWPEPAGKRLFSIRELASLPGYAAALALSRSDCRIVPRFFSAG